MKALLIVILVFYNESPAMRIEPMVFIAACEAAVAKLKSVRTPVRTEMRAWCVENQ